MNISPKTLDQFRGDFDKAMKALEAQYGVSIELGRIGYDDSKFSAKMTVYSASEGNNGKQEEWASYAPLFGLNESWFGQTVKLSSGKVGTIVGIAPRSKKYPVIVDTTDGKSYKMTAESVSKQLNGTPVAPTSNTPKVEKPKAPKGKETKLDIARALYNSGTTRPCDIAKVMDISNAYASKLVKKISAE